MARIGIRHETKSLHEARTPLTPEAVRSLITDHGVAVTVQASPVRAFSAADYKSAGASITDELSDCSVILGVKEIPAEMMERGKTYLFFSHTVKGQPENMPALKRLMELGCTLIDYERIVDEKDQRLVFFGRFAGLAGMIDALWALGRRLRYEGITSPFESVTPARLYNDLEHAKQEIGKVSEVIRNHGLPDAMTPFVCGFAGYGQVSQGAQEIYDLLPVKEVEPSELPDLPAEMRICYKVVFKEEHSVRRADASQPFDLQEYNRHPDRYESDFFRHVPHLTTLVNCIYWEPRYPRLITRDQFRQLYADGQPRLRVIADITCDINGSLACTTHATYPGNPIYVYNPVSGATCAGEAGTGPVVLAIDFLPAEIPIDSSHAFSAALEPFIPALANADFSRSLAESGLPPELARAVIVYRGKLTEPYHYIRDFIH
ncbi:MAG: hypothetical protein JSV91_15905 [Phycisphaerales bacterium]|nr:MAG: hypothetical protein JSV91_15905 [Phycisphaerales bacterium]